MKLPYSQVKYAINLGFFSTIYAQKFEKNNYIKLEYPSLKFIKETSTIKIRIQKIEAYFKLMTTINPVISTMVVNEYQKPIYVFAYNTQPDLSDSYYTIYGKIHSREFFGSYKTIKFDPEYSIDKNFKDLVTPSVTSLPYNFDLYIVKLKCKEPGIITIYMEKGNFYSVLGDIGLSPVQNKIL